MVKVQTCECGKQHKKCNVKIWCGKNPKWNVWVRCMRCVKWKEKGLETFFGVEKNVLYLFIFSCLINWLFHTPAYTDTDLVRGFESRRRSSDCWCGFGMKSVLQTCCSECALPECDLQQVSGSVGPVTASGFDSQTTIWLVSCGLRQLDNLRTKKCPYHLSCFEF